jgi:hypothetical protein
MPGGVLTSLPLIFIRQQDEPIDVDSTFATTAERLAYLTNPRRYGGLVSYDLEADALFVLNAAKTAWLPVGGSGTVSPEIVSFSGATLNLPWTPQRITNFGAAGSFTVEILGSDGKYRVTLVEIVPDNIINTTEYDFDFGGIQTGRIIIK